MSGSSVSKRKTILWLGVAIALMPFLGFPSGWKTIFYLISGTLIAWNSYQLNRHNKQTKHRRRGEKTPEKVIEASNIETNSSVPPVQEKKEEVNTIPTI